MISKCFILRCRNYEVENNIFKGDVCFDIIYLLQKKILLSAVKRYDDVFFANAGEEIVTEMAIVGIAPAPAPAPHLRVVTVTADLDLVHALDRRGICYILV
jgi:hypothetical protein